MKKGTQARARLATVIALASRRRAPRALVHHEQIVTGQLVPFAPKRLNHARPVVGRDAASLPPFLDPGTRLAEIGSHLRERVPSVENIVKRAQHDAEYASDGLSVQEPTMIPMTTVVPMQTISPMGRGTTPVRFRAEMAKRLRSARVVAGYSTQKQAADALRIGLDRYEKWENGRTPIPAQYIGPICQLYGVDANYLYDIEPRRTAAAVRESA